MFFRNLDKLGLINEQFQATKKSPFTRSPQTENLKRMPKRIKGTRDPRLEPNNQLYNYTE